MAAIFKKDKKPKYTNQISQSFLRAYKLDFGDCLQTFKQRAEFYSRVLNTIIEDTWRSRVFLVGDFLLGFSATMEIVVTVSELPKKFEQLDITMLKNVFAMDFRNVNIFPDFITSGAIVSFGPIFCYNTMVIVHVSLLSPRRFLDNLLLPQSRLAVVTNEYKDGKYKFFVLADMWFMTGTTSTIKLRRNATHHDLGKFKQLSRFGFLAPIKFDNTDFVNFFSDI